MVETQYRQSYSVEVSTAPSVEPLTTSFAKLHMREDNSEQDNRIAMLITAARIAAERETQRSLVTQTLKLRFDKFPNSREIVLPRPPLLTVTSIGYIDEDGASQTLASSSYQTDITSPFGRVRLEPEASWPTTEYDRVNAVTVTYTAGYGTTQWADSATPGSVPANIINGMLILIKHMYDQPDLVKVGSSIQEVPRSIENNWSISRVHYGI